MLVFFRHFSGIPYFYIYKNKDEINNLHNIQLNIEKKVMNIYLTIFFSL